MWVQCIVGRLWTNLTANCVRVYLELHQVDVHVSAVAVLSHRVRELCDSVAGRSQPRLDLGEVEDDLPVSYSVERRRLHRPEATQTQRETGPTRRRPLFELSTADWLPPGRVWTRVRSSPGQAASAGAG